MTDQQRLFADQYLILNNGTKAAIAAGYSEKSARSQASQLLVVEEIEEYIESQRKEAQTRTGITIDRVLSEYSKIAFFDIREVYDVDGGLIHVKQLDDNSAGAIASIKSYEEWGEDEEGNKVVTGINKEVKIFDKIRALQDLGKHLGMFEKDNSQKTPEAPKTLKIEIVRPVEEDE